DDDGGVCGADMDDIASGAGQIEGARREGHLGPLPAAGGDDLHLVVVNLHADRTAGDAGLLPTATLRDIERRVAAVAGDLQVNFGPGNRDVAGRAEGDEFVTVVRRDARRAVHAPLVGSGAVRDRRITIDNGGDVSCSRGDGVVTFAVQRILAGQYDNVGRVRRRADAVAAGRSDFGIVHAAEPADGDDMPGDGGDGQQAGPALDRLNTATVQDNGVRQ